MSVVPVTPVCPVSHNQAFEVSSAQTNMTLTTGQAYRSRKEGHSPMPLESIVSPDVTCGITWVQPREDCIIQAPSQSENGELNL